MEDNKFKFWYVILNYIIATSVELAYFLQSDKGTKFGARLKFLNLHRKYAEIILNKEYFDI